MLVLNYFAKFLESIVLNYRIREDDMNANMIHLN